MTVFNDGDGFAAGIARGFVPRRPAGAAGWARRACRGRRRRSRGPTRMAGSGRRHVEHAQDGGTGGRDALHGRAGGVDRRIAEQGQRGGRGHGQRSVLACTVPLPTFSGEASQRSTPSASAAGGGADDIDDGVDRAHLVEVDLLDGNGVDARFRFAEQLEGAAGAGLHRSASGAARMISRIAEKRTVMRVRTCSVNVLHACGWSWLCSCLLMRGWPGLRDADALVPLDSAGCRTMTSTLVAGEAAAAHLAHLEARAHVEGGRGFRQAGRKERPHRRARRAACRR